MKDFRIKLANMNDLFICKFSVSDYVNNKLKIYYISPDSDHGYLTVNQIQNSDHHYECTIGDLYVNGKTSSVFEDTEIEQFTINRKDFKDFVNYYNSLPNWHKSNIIDIEKNYGNNLVV